MTIVTKPLTDEKKDLKPLVDIDNGKFGPEMLEKGDMGSGQSIAVYQSPYKKHKISFLICLVLLVTLTISCAIMGSLYLYYRFSKPEGYRTNCRIYYPPPKDFGSASALRAPLEPQPLFIADTQDSGVVDSATADSLRPMDALPSVVSETTSDDDTDGAIKSLAVQPDPDLQSLMNSFNQDFEIDVMKQLWEILQVPRVPQLGLGRPARFIHDFSMNLTAILDAQSQECYVMPLNRSVIKPPRDLFEMLKGLEDGSYTLDDRSIIQQTYYVDPLPVLDYDRLGVFITRECYNYPTYMLIKRDDVSRKRRSTSVAQQKDVRTYGEVMGHKLHKINIVK